MIIYNTTYIPKQIFCFVHLQMNVLFNLQAVTFGKKIKSKEFMYILLNINNGKWTTKD